MEQGSHMKKKTNIQPPVVSSYSTILRKVIGDEIATAEEMQERKKDVLSIIDDSLVLFKNNLASGNVSMTTSSDLERIVKLMLLISGEADSRAGKPLGEVESETVVTTPTSSIPIDKIESILSQDSESVQDIYNKLYTAFNESNQID